MWATSTVYNRQEVQMDQIPQLLRYSDDELPAHLKWQTLSFLRAVWPEDFAGDARSRDWITRSDVHPVHFVLTQNALLISYAGVVWRYLEHGGTTYKVYGISGVFTYPAHQGEGHGKHIVGAAMNYIRHAPDADFAMLWCRPPLREFYLNLGWEHLNTARVIENRDNPSVEYAELLMMLFLSDKGRAGRTDFAEKPIYFSDPW
jgi:GNAT superfamily N-acetyltransferase